MFWEWIKGELRLTRDSLTVIWEWFGVMLEMYWGRVGGMLRVC